jgi:hypothetical protein
MSLGDIATAISTLFGAITLFAGVIKYWRQQNDERLITWQRVVVHSIVEAGAPNGLFLSEILTRYREQALTYIEFNVSKKAMSEPVLRFALLGLQGMNLIARTPEGRYILYVAGPSLHEMLEEQRKSKATADAIMATVIAESGHYTRDQLRSKLEPVTEVSSVQFEGILNALVAQQQVLVVNGMLTRRT